MDRVSPDGAPQLYPEPLRAEIDEVGPSDLHRDQQRRVPLRVRRFPRAYDAAFDRLFTALDWVWAGWRPALSGGDTITEADVRLFTTLARFDPVYHGHFKCNRQKLAEMPVLWAYARTCSRRRASGTPSTSVQIKQHYYVVHADINPTRIVPRARI